MAGKSFKERAQGLLKNKYALLVLLVGAVLMLLPDCSGGTEAASGTAEGLSAPVFSVTEQEAKLAETIAAIRGAGETRVMLALKGGVARELAQAGGEAVIVSAGSGTQTPVELRYVYPEYRGAVVVCQGAGDPAVCLAVTRAVAAVTGLGSDKITVVRLRE